MQADSNQMLLEMIRNKIIPAENEQIFKSSIYIFTTI